MRARITTLALLACLVIVGWHALPAGGTRTGAASSPPPSPDTATPRAPEATVPPALLGHVDDYSAPASQLIGHLDHLDLSRLPEATRLELEAELSRRQDARAALWAAYGGPTGRVTPADVAVLGLPELVYLLMSRRAYALANALADAGDLTAAYARVGADPPSVAVSVSSSSRGPCVTLVPAADPFGRTYSSRASEVPTGPGVQQLQEYVRIGADPAGGSCDDGQPPSFSPGAERAVSALG